MGKGHIIHLWAHIRMFLDNAFYAIKGNLRREKWKREGRVRSWRERDARSPWASKYGEEWQPVTLQAWFRLQTWIPVASRISGRTNLQALQYVTSFQEALDRDCPPHHQGEGRIIITSVSDGSFQNTHPHIFPYFWKHSSSNSQTPYKEKQYYIINILYWILPLIHKTIFHWQLEVLMHKCLKGKERR